MAKVIRKAPKRKLKNDKDGMNHIIKQKLGSYDRTIKFTDKELPEAKEWQVGKTYELDVTVKQISRTERDKQDAITTFEIIAVRKS